MNDDYPTQTKLPAEIIAGFSGLKALDLRGVFTLVTHEDAHFLEATLKQLTELSLGIDWHVLPGFASLTKLVRLQLSGSCSTGVSLDDTLSCMPHLRSLCITHYTNYSWSRNEKDFVSVTLSSSTLARMDQLESLSLTTVTVDESFFHQLASAAKLTKLIFYCSVLKSCDRWFLSQVNLLHTLKELEVCPKDGTKLSEMLSPEQLNRLEKLTIKDSAEDTSTVRKKFVSVGEVMG